MTIKHMFQMQLTYESISKINIQFLKPQFMDKNI